VDICVYGTYRIIYTINTILLGNSIDGLMIDNWHWMVLLGICYFLSNFFNYRRMVYDTKVYTTIYNDIALKFLKKQDVDTSTK
jgi:hypothetical protein